MSGTGGADMLGPPGGGAPAPEVRPFWLTISIYF